MNSLTRFSSAASRVLPCVTLCFVNRQRERPVVYCPCLVHVCTQKEVWYHTHHGPLTRWLANSLVLCVLSIDGRPVMIIFHSGSCAYICARYGATEIKLGVGLNTLATERSFENSFLSILEEEFKADVSWVALLTRHCHARPCVCMQSDLNPEVFAFS